MCYFKVVSGRKMAAALPIGMAVCAAGCLVFRAGNWVSVSAAQKELPIYSVERKDKVCALTFDAAWGNEDTQQLIDILKTENIQATFFVVGAWEIGRAHV